MSISDRSRWTHFSHLLMNRGEKRPTDLVKFISFQGLFLPVMIGDARYGITIFHRIQLGVSYEI